MKWNPIRSAARWVAMAASNIAGMHPRDQELARLWGLTTPSSSGEPVTDETSRGLPAYFACVRVLSEDVGKIPFQVYERDVRGGRMLASDHPAYDLLHTAPSDESTAMSFRESLTADALSMGNGYAEIQRNGRGDPVALYKLDSKSMRVLRAKDGSLVYKYLDTNGQEQTIRQEDVLHIHGLGGDSIMGWSILRYGMESIGLALSQQVYGASFFGNGAAPRVAIEVPGNPSPETLSVMKRSWEENHGDKRKAGTAAFLVGGVKVHTYTVPPEEAQFLESRQFSIEEMCRWFRIPPHKVQHLLRSTFSNIEQQSIEYVVDTIHPWLVRWEQEVNRKLFRPSERKRLYAEHNVEGLLRGDSATRAAFYKTLWEMGVLSTNDILRKENMPPIGAEGDKRFVPMNFIPLDKAGEETQDVNPPQAQDTQQPPVQPPNGADDPNQRAATTAAIREVLASILGRMVDNERTAVMRMAKKPSNFIGPVSSFFDKQAETVYEAIYPTVKAWTVWMGQDSPETLCAWMTEEHCEKARTEVMYASECQAEELMERMEKLTDSWKDKAEREAAEFFKEGGE